MKIFRTDRERMRRLHETHITHHTKEFDAALLADLDRRQWKAKPVGENKTKAEHPVWTSTSEVTKV